MKLLLENWRRFLNEAVQTEIYKISRDLHRIIFDAFKNEALPNFNKGKRHHQFVAKEKDKPIKNNIPNPYDIESIFVNFEWVLISPSKYKEFLDYNDGIPWEAKAQYRPPEGSISGPVLMFVYKFAVPTKNFDFKQYLEQFNHDLMERLAHELTHAKQQYEGRISDTESEINNLNNISGLKKYFLNSPLDEKEAFIRGMYYRARREKKDLQEIIKHYFHSIFNKAIANMREEFKSGDLQIDDVKQRREELLSTILLIIKEYQTEAKNMYS